MSRNTEKPEKLEMHTLGTGISEKTEKPVK
jgi:hypothetical protein